MSVLVSFLVIAGGWLPGTATNIANRTETPVTHATGRPWKPPPPKPVTAVTAAVGGCPGPVVAAINNAFGTAAPWAIRIAWRESRCQPGARNRSGASGLFQLMLPLHNNLFTAVGCTPRAWADVSCNVAAARRLYQIAGTAPWHL